MNLTKHQERKIRKLQHEIDYFCGQPCFEVSPIIEVTPMAETESILIHIRNAPNSRWYETRISFWAYITPRGKIQKCASSIGEKSIYDKHFKSA